MDVYWSVEQCRWLPSPVREEPRAEPAVPAQREAEEPEPVART